MLWSLVGGASAQTAAPSGSPPQSAGGATFGMESLVARMDWTTLVVLIAATLVILLFAWYVWTLVRRERRARPKRAVTHTPRSRQTGRGHTVRSGSADWDQAERKRGARDGKSDYADLDLPSITVATTHWPEIDRLKIPSQAGWIAGTQSTLGANSGQTESVYRTGYNPFYRPDERIEVEEVADVVTQAELLTHLGETKQAILLLSRHIREHEKPAPKAWLMLFELYVKTGRETHYKSLGDGFRVLFNAEVPPWSANPDALSKDLEQYPLVMEKVQQLWGIPTCRGFLDSLLHDDRGGSRQGFMFPAYVDILFLIETIDLLDVMKSDTLGRRPV